MRIREHNDRLLAELADGSFDFIDIGTHEGAGFGIGRHFNRTRGLGFELDPAKVEVLTNDKLDVICGDISEFHLPKRVAEIAVMNHILEHLPNLPRIGSLVDGAAACCSDFLYIAWPYFDSDLFLARHRLRAVHTLITEHICRFTTKQFARLLWDLDLNDFIICGETPMRDSNDAWLHRADAPDNAWTWEPHFGEKPEVIFDKPVYRNAICLVALRPGLNLEALAMSMRGEHVLIRSQFRF